MASTPNVTYTPVDACFNLTTNTATSVYTAPSSGQSTGGAKVGVLRAINADTKSFTVLIYKTIASVDYLIGSFVLGAGTATTPATVDILSLIWGSAMNMAPSTGLKFKLDSAPTSSNLVFIHLEGASF